MATFAKKMETTTNSDVISLAGVVSQESND